MDKRTAIEWLVGFICTESIDELTETAELLAADIDIPIAEALEVVTACEKMLQDVFAAWLADTSEEIDEEAEMNDAADSADKTETVAEEAASVPAEPTKATKPRLDTSINPDA